MKTQKQTVELSRRVRLHVLDMIHRSNSSHIGSCFSIADILAVLYGEILNFDPTNPRWEARDRLILSKGHAAAVLYATLAEVGFFPSADLKNFNQDATQLSGHVIHRIPGVEVSTGALGHGLSIGCGMAYAGKLNNDNHKVFVLLSDGECDEGAIWEAALFAGHNQLDNLVTIVDYNKIQSLGRVKEVLDLEPFADKWRAFGWSVIEVDGHHHDSLLNTFAKLPLLNNIPTVVIAHTVKGKGVSFMEDKLLWHYKSPNEQEYETALTELGYQHENSIY